MLTAEKLRSYEKSALKDVSDSLQEDDISQLIQWLEEKDDQLRYFSLLVLQHRSDKYKDVYPYWDIFAGKLTSKNSYQRSIGLMMIAANIKWDEQNKFDKIFDLYLSLCNDEKPVTVRQCIQSLCLIVPYKKHMHDQIIGRLTTIDIMQRKETQRKILLLDIISVLTAIRAQTADERIEAYLLKSLSGEILDKKSKREIEKILKN